MIPTEQTSPASDRDGPAASERAPPSTGGQPVAATSAVIKSVLSSSRPVADGDGYRLADDVILVVVHDGSARLVDLGGNVSAITASGAAMLEFTLGHGMEAAAQALAARYRVDTARIQADMAALFRSLEKQGVLVAAATTRRRSALRRMLAGAIGPLVLLCARRPARATATKAWLLMTLAFAATRLLGWSDTIRVWDRAGARLMAARGAGGAEPDILGAVDAVVTRAVAQHPLAVGCKERALCCWALARAGGVPARIQLGIELFPFGLHCWCEHGSQILADRWEGRCDRYTPILVYG